MRVYWGFFKEFLLPAMVATYIVVQALWFFAESFYKRGLEQGNERLQNCNQIIAKRR